MGKAIDSLIVGVEIFNRPDDCGRVTTCLIMMDHAFEMLLKATILHRGGRIREKRRENTIGFEACVTRCLSINVLSKEQAFLLRSINGLRDAAQHHLIDIIEGHLYVMMQAGVSLFRDLLKGVFDHELGNHLPSRVLPLSTLAPIEISSLFEIEAEEIRKLLTAGQRRGADAKRRLRPLAIMESAFGGESTQPSEGDLSRLAKRMSEGEEWSAVFAGVSSIRISSDDSGQRISLHITKNDGLAVTLVDEGTPGATMLAQRRVNELGFYTMGPQKLADKLGISVPRLNAIVDHLGIKGDKNCYKEFKLRGTPYHQYSQFAMQRIRQCMETEDLDAIWERDKERRRKLKDVKSTRSR